MPCYFFSNGKVCSVLRGQTGPGGAFPSAPVSSIAAWKGWPASGTIDDALYSVTKMYFFSGREYIRVSMDDPFGAIDPGYPAPILNWGWKDFGANGIDAALYSGSVCYFFSGQHYIRVRRGNQGPGTVDPGYPAPIANWGWGAFGAHGIDAALYSGPVCYFFSGDQYIRVTRGDTGPGTVDRGYPAPLTNWEFSDPDFNARITGAAFGGIFENAGQKSA